MKRIPVTKLIRGQAEAIVYYDDYQEEIELDNVPSHLSYPLPEYTIEGDKDLVEEFNDFVSQSDDILFGEHFPMPWSKAGRLTYLFAKENGVEEEDILPKEYDELLNRPHKPGVIVD
jgi:hypothetical protein